MGGAVTGFSNGALSIFWNPAGITGTTGESLHFSQIPWMEFFDVTAFAFTLNAGNWGTFGLHAIALGMESMEITTEFSPGGTGQFFDAQDLAVGVTYARQLTDRFSTGLTGKLIRQRIWNETASGFAFDVGTRYQLDFRNLTLAMSMNNFGPDLKYTGPDLLVTYDENNVFPNRLVQANQQTEAYPLPLTFQFGIVADLFRSPFLLARVGIDAIHPNDNAERVHLGVEAAFAQRLYLRGGTKFNHDDETHSFGAGVKTRIGSATLALDMAYVLHERLPNVQVMSMGLNF
jgi:hypothetical protein